jgi:hypothetical protein
LGNVTLVTQNVAAIVRYCHHWSESGHGYAATTGQLGQPNEILDRGSQREHPTDRGQTAVPRLAEAGGCLGPA